jgi:hypothetical protein
MDTPIIAVIVAISWLLCLFLRLPLGIMLDNRETGEDKSVFDYSRMEHLAILFYWWDVDKKENRVLAIVLNIMLLIWVSGIFGGAIYSEIINKGKLQ